MSIEHGDRRSVYGICIHTTGDGIPAAALRDTNHPLCTARAVYENMGLIGPHYVIAPDGSHEELCDPRLIRQHVGLAADVRRDFINGTWLNPSNRITPAVVSWWQERWPGVKSPSHLYPSRSANEDYIGIECIPAGSYSSAAGKWTWRWGSKTGFDQQRFSVECYRALAGLVLSLAGEFKLDLVKPGVLVGHEDLNPYTRPGWDPGSYNKTFSWDMLRGCMAVLAQENKP